MRAVDGGTDLVHEKTRAREAVAIAGVVLAAGTSSRLGRPKQLVVVDGKPMVQHVVDALLAAGVHEVVVVLGHEADAVRAALAPHPRVRAVVNPDHAAGLSSSLVVGLRSVSARAGAVAIVLGDQPRLPAEVIARVVRVWRHSAAGVVRARFEGVPGHPVVAARAAWDRLMRATGDGGARDLLGPDAEEVEIEAPAPIDVDTPGDLERLRRTSPPDG